VACCFLLLFVLSSIPFVFCFDLVESSALWQGDIYRLPFFVLCGGLKGS